MAVLTILSANLFSQTKAGKVDTSKHFTIYTCPMHDAVAAKKPGNCPICGMKLQLSKKEEMNAGVTKNYACPMHPAEVSDKPGVCSKCGMNMNLSAKEKNKIGAMNNYTCPMHDDVNSDKPGKCPNCGMKLTVVKKKTSAN
jgi:uncharacterized paraquat-inducible protein A